MSEFTTKPELCGIRTVYEDAMRLRIWDLVPDTQKRMVVGGLGHAGARSKKAGSWLGSQRLRSAGAEVQRLRVPHKKELETSERLTLLP